MGWKAITEFLGWADEETARAWADDPRLKEVCPLPVARYGGKTVMSTRSLLEAWIQDLVRLSLAGRLPGFVREKLAGGTGEASELPLFRKAGE